MTLIKTWFFSVFLAGTPPLEDGNPSELSTNLTPEVDLASSSGLGKVASAATSSPSRGGGRSERSSDTRRYHTAGAIEDIKVK